MKQEAERKNKQFCSLEREMREREMNNSEWAGEKHQILWEKMNRVGKRGGQSTPVASFWRTNQLSGNEKNRNLTGDYASFKVPSVSSRKLGATLWEIHHYNLPLDNNHHGSTVSPPTLRRRRHLHHLKPYKDKGSPDTIPPYNLAAAPSSSTGLKGRTFDATYSLKTSTQLLKVLNRIWSLEEQHISNISLIKSLKKELNDARSQIKVLVRDQNEKCEAANLS